jgi:N-methylhydantoinase A/oxoprolinase/acetone carboxylase beta subunit
MAILINQAPLLDPLGIDLGGYKTLIRSLKSKSLGIGGDSVVRVVDGKITVGPDREGFAMVYGGSIPTPTDALAVMGELEDGDTEKAVKGFEELGARLGISGREAAEAAFRHACQRILVEAEAMVAEINSKPVYTVHELQEGYQVKPKKIMILGGPAPYFASHLEKMSGYQVTPVPRWKVANAIGAALARTTCEVSLFADTERGILTSPEEKFKKNISADFSREKAIRIAYDLLKTKAIETGADEEDLEFELLEDQQFNMVRGFHTTGKNIRIKAQVKPGLIHRYHSIVEKLTD